MARSVRFTSTCGKMEIGIFVPKFEMQNYSAGRSATGRLRGDAETNQTQVVTGQVQTTLPRTGHHNPGGVHQVDTETSSRQAKQNCFKTTYICCGRFAHIAAGCPQSDRQSYFGETASKACRNGVWTCPDTVLLETPSGSEALRPEEGHTSC